MLLSVVCGGGFRGLVTFYRDALDPYCEEDIP